MRGQREHPMGGQPVPIVGSDRIDEVIACIRAGGVAGIPTDTVYGLAALPDHPGALAALADLKGRDRDQPVAALLDTPEGATRFLDDPAALERVRRFWPGALTAVVRARPGGLLPPVATAAGTVGLRVPDDDLARAVIRACGGILAVSSANTHGAPPCLDAHEVAEAFPGLLVLDGGRREGGVASTVVNLASDPPRILRAGPISASDLGIEG